LGKQLAIKTKKAINQGYLLEKILGHIVVNKLEISWAKTKGRKASVSVIQNQRNEMYNSPQAMLISKLTVRERLKQR